MSNSKTNLTFPRLRWPYYWCIEVGSSDVYVGIKRRWLRIFTTSIGWTHCDYIRHQGVLADSHFIELENRAVKLAEQVNPARDVRYQLRQLRRPVPIQIKKR